MAQETPWSSLLRHDYWGAEMSSSRSHKSYRPLSVATLRANYAWSGVHDSSGYHLVNILLHALCSWAVLACLSGRTATSRRVAVTAALLFALHPIHTEAVASVTVHSELPLQLS